MPLTDKTRLRNFCFTSYDVSDEMKERIKNLDVKYMIYGNEICPDTGKAHLQGYCELNKQSSVRTIKTKMFMYNGLHLESRIGTATQASTYCKKEGDFWEQGELSKQGARTDISEIKDQIKNGSSFRDVIETATSYQSLRIAEKILVYYEKPRTWKTEVYWYHGTTGTGKTKHAYALSNNPWISSGDLKWFQGYDGHEDVIFDDFRPSQCSYATLLRLTDRYPYQIEYKGGSRQFVPKRIFITSSMSPTDMFPDYDDSVNQLLRRIKEIKLFTKSTSFQHALQKELFTKKVLPQIAKND